MSKENAINLLKAKAALFDELVDLAKAIACCLDHENPFCTSNTENYCPYAGKCNGGVYPKAQALLKKARSI